jgi:5S rRNA maturation endonuclease (ribonuclease M5)
MTAESLAYALGGHKSGAQWIARCPSHDDRNPSLGLRDEGDIVLLRCYAGCAQETVIDALKKLGLWESRGEPLCIIATYDYTDENGKLLYQIVRQEPKNFRQRYPDGAGGWIWKKHPRQVLYRLPEVLEASIVFVAEGEKDVETLRQYGFVATTNAGGANAHWLPAFTKALAGREIILIPDRDAPGRRRVLNIARALLGYAAKITVFEPEVDGVKDITDWFEKGHSELELIGLLGPDSVAR